MTTPLPAAVILTPGGTLSDPSFEGGDVAAASVESRNFWMADTDSSSSTPGVNEERLSTDETRPENTLTFITSSRFSKFLTSHRRIGKFLKKNLKNSFPIYVYFSPFEMTLLALPMTAEPR